jgi:hypothetical protein
LSIVASSDIGGLGAKEGFPVSLTWTLPNPLPPLLPWLAMLILLTLKPNRSPAAWWIWLPLAILTLAGFGLEKVLDAIPGNFPDTFPDTIASLVFGLAAVWLLTPYLVRSHRFVTCLCLLLALAGFASLSFVVRQDWSGPIISELPMGILLAVSVFVTSVAIALAGLVCRGRFRVTSLSVWMFVFLLGLWLVITTPFFAFAAIATSGQVPWLGFFGGILMLAAISFALVLPFLILSAANSFFRERLKALLHLDKQMVPTPIAAPVENRAHKS